MTVEIEDVTTETDQALAEAGTAVGRLAGVAVAAKIDQVVESKIGVGVGEIVAGVETVIKVKDKIDEIGGIANIGSVLEDFSPGEALASLKGNATGLVSSALKIAGLGEYTTKTIETVFDSDGVPTTIETTSGSTLSQIILAITGLGFRSNLLDGFKDIVNMTADAGGVVAAAKNVLVGGYNDIKSSLVGVGTDFDGTVGAAIESSIDTLTGKVPNTGLDQAALLGIVSDAPESVLTTVVNIKNEISSVTAAVEEAQARVNTAINNVEKGVGALQQAANRVNDETDDEPISAEDVDVFSRARLISSNLSISTQDVQEVFGPAYSIDNNDTTSFEYISSVEELRAEIIGRVPDVSTCVIHWTDTYLDQNIGSEEIDTYQKELGHSKGIQYHYVIRRNGVVQRGLNPQRRSIHTNTDHDNVSIAIAFVGGYNCPSGTKNPDRYRNARSLTRAQFNSFEEICRTLYFKFPGIQIVGHNDIDADQPDPGFDVIEYCNDVFGKESVFDGEVIPLNKVNERTIL